MRIEALSNTQTSQLKATRSAGCSLFLRAGHVVSRVEVPRHVRCRISKAPAVTGAELCAVSSIRHLITWCGWRRCSVVLVWISSIPHPF